MIKAIVIELDYEDGYVVEHVYSTEPVQCTIVYPDGVAMHQEVEVQERKVLSRMAPVPLAALSYEDAMGMTLGPTPSGLQPTTIAGILKNLARLRLKQDLGENPDEWGLTVKSELYEYVCYGKYSGEVYKEDGN